MSMCYSMSVFKYSFLFTFTIRADMPTPTPQEESIPTINKLLLSSVPSFLNAFQVLKNINPLDVIKASGIKLYGLPIALLMLMLVAWIILLAGESVPFNSPYDAVWTYKFEQFYPPKKGSWVVLWALLGVLIPYLFVNLVCLAVAGYLNDWQRTKETVHLALLAGYTVMAVLFTFILTLLLVTGAGWLASLFNSHFFVLRWLIVSTCLLLPLTTWGILKILQRTPATHKPKLVGALLISCVTLLGSTWGALYTIDYLTKAMLSQGSKVNGARNAPTGAVVQECLKDATDIVCAVTLFPSKWQDYELIGDWKLGSVDDKRNHHVHSTWSSAKEADRKYALLHLEAGKDLTVEIRSQLSSLCTAGKATVKKDDIFFIVRGRIRGVQHLLPQEMRLRVDNMNNSFSAMLDKACEEA